MASGTAARAHYLGTVDFTTERGVFVTGRAITFEKGIRFLELFDLVQAGHPGAILMLLKEFQEATGIGDAQCSPVEALQEVIPHFLGLSGTAKQTPTSTSTSVPTS